VNVLKSRREVEGVEEVGWREAKSSGMQNAEMNQKRRGLRQLEQRLTTGCTQINNSHRFNVLTNQLHADNTKNNIDARE
jgi:hypothetical protein